MVKQIATSTVLALLLASTATSVGQVSTNTTGAQTLDPAYYLLKQKPKPKPKPKPITSVPEPGSLLLFGAALLAGTGARKRKA